MRTRLVAVVLAIVALSAVAWIGWRSEVQTVNLVVVNGSRTPVELTWQPQPFADDVEVIIGACESRSIELRAGMRWRLAHDRLDMNSSIVEVPPLTREVAVEVWLAADGSSRYVSAHPVDGAVDAPSPTGCAESL